MTAGRRHLRPVQWIAVAIACSWAAALPIDAYVAPAYSSTSVTGSSAAPGSGPGDASVTVTHTSATLVQENGSIALLVTAVPLLVTVVVICALWRRSPRKPGAGPLAWSVVGLLVAGNLVAMLSIGVFVLPVTAALVLACATHSTGPAMHGRAGSSVSVL